MAQPLSFCHGNLPVKRLVRLRLPSAAAAFLLATCLVQPCSFAQEAIGGMGLSGPHHASSLPPGSQLKPTFNGPRHRTLRVASPSLEPSSADASVDFNQRRERLYNELAEEFSAFERLGNLVRRVSQVVKPSVIHIEAHKTEEKAGLREAYDEAGSGVLISAGGESWILTNRHVILGAAPNEILLRTSDGREMTPTRVLSDATTDVAVMRIEAAGIPTARLGDSEAVEIGDFVIAIGSPFGLSHSVTFGILSAKGRRDLSLGTQKIDLQDFFQTDAAINPGNSGGPLLNLRGEVIGINTAIASSSGGSEGIGFAIPINMAVRVADQLIRYGQIRRGYLGVTLDPDFSSADVLSAGLDSARGAMVKNVRAGSPASAARLQRGDIILRFGDVTIEDDVHLVARVGLAAVGKAVPLVILRDGKRYQTEVVLTSKQ